MDDGDVETGVTDGGGSLADDPRLANVFERIARALPRYQAPDGMTPYSLLESYAPARRGGDDETGGNVMNETTITRRQAIEAGTSYLSLLILALLASAVPPPQPAPTLPDWLADDPELAAAFERYVRVTKLLRWEDDDVPSKLLNSWSAMLETRVERLRATRQD